MINIYYTNSLPSRLLQLLLLHETQNIKVSDEQTLHAFEAKIFAQTEWDAQ